MKHFTPSRENTSFFLRDIATNKFILVAIENEFPRDENDIAMSYDMYSSSSRGSYTSDNEMVTGLANEFLTSGFVLKSFSILETSYMLASFYEGTMDGSGYSYSKGQIAAANVTILNVDAIKDRVVREGISQPQYRLLDEDEMLDFLKDNSRLRRLFRQEYDLES